MCLRYGGNDKVGAVPLVFAAIAGAVVLVVLIVAYRRHRVAASIAVLNSANAQLERDRGYRERFTAAAAQVGDEKAAIQLAGVRAMAELADAWPERRQTCVDALCAHLRRLNSPDAGLDTAADDQPKSGSTRDVRRAVIKIIAAHLRLSANVSWRSLDFDFTGAVFDGGDFSHAGFSGGEISFSEAKFRCGEISFSGARFSGGRVSFAGAEFSGSQVSFAGAEFSGEASFAGAEFSGSQVSFGGAEFSGSEVDFADAEFSGGHVDFRRGRFSGGEVSF